MEFRHIQAFVTLADTLNFSRASETLYLSQPTLSRYISLLEQELGVSLLLRDTHSVELTPQGASFLKDARDILDSTLRAVHNVRNFVPPSAEGHLYIGYEREIDQTTEMAGILTAHIVAFQTLNPGTTVKVNIFPTNELAQALQCGALDLAIVFYEINDLETFVDAAFNSVPLFSDQFVVVAARDEYTDYKNTPLNVLLQDYHTVFLPPYRHIRLGNVGDVFEAMNLFPFVRFLDSWVEIITRVSNREGFTFCPMDQYRKLRMENLTAIELPKRFSAGIQALWKKSTDNPHIQRFVGLETDLPSLER